VLKAVIDRRGPSSETLGILARVYRNRWEDSFAQGSAFLFRGLLDQAIETYQRGFETDWHDARPGINTVTLTELRDPPDPVA
jgi:hypothetical protein